jgi:CCR4-NOT transcription complex subunit 6
MTGVFRVLNWNLLHSLESSRLQKFHYCQPGTLQIHHRVGSILRCVHLYRPDIVCFQELDQQLMNFIEPGIKDSLSRACVSLNDALPSKDGCGVYYNSRRFSLSETSVVRFRNLVDKYFPSLTRSAGRDSSALSLTRALDRELREKVNMAIFTRLNDKVTGKSLVAASSHLFWNPQFPDLKLLQSYILAREALEFASSSDAMMIGADLNSVPHSSAVYELLMGSGTVTTSHPDHPVTLRKRSATSPSQSAVRYEAVPDLALQAPFRSAIRTLTGNEPFFTNYTASFKGCLDYIMLGGGIQTVNAIRLPPEAELLEETALPNSKWPSDHLPLVVDLEFR